MKKCLFILLLALLFVMVSCDDKVNDGIIDDGETKVTEVTLSQVGQTSKLDVEISASSNIKDYTMQVFSTYEEEEIEIASYDGKLENGHVKEEVETNGYGKLKVKISFPGQTDVIEREVEVVADEYTFVLIPATLPVTAFTLEYLSGEYPSAPTFVGFERCLSYNWDNLPENMYRNPKISKEDNDTTNLKFHTHQVPRMMDLVKELHELSPEAKINFVTSDIYPELIVKVLFWNGISDANITLYSDGTATYSHVKSQFGDDDAKASWRYVKFTRNWEEIKKSALGGGKDCLEAYEEEWGKYATLRMYTPIIAQEDNVTWKVGRKSLLESKDTNIQDLIQGAAEQFNLGNMLKALDEEKSKALKALYNFDTNVFEESRKNGKKIMVFLGTRNDYTNGHLEDYLSFIKEYYGGEYDLYYKGHPAEPSGLPQFEDKKNIFETIGCKEVEASIPAEIILFFCPDIDLCGYPSTTFQSAEAEHVFTIMGSGETTIDSLKDTCTKNGYIDMVDSFIAINEDGTYTLEVVSEGDYTWDPDSKTATKVTE